MFRTIDTRFLAAPQIAAEDVAIAIDLGVRLIIDNRPDGEEPSAAQSEEIAAACAAQGVAFVYIPISHTGFSHPQIDAMRAALDGAGDGVVLAYCRSGTRSTNLWALAEAKAGRDPEAICAKAAAGGYDLGGIRPKLDMLAGQAG